MCVGRETFPYLFTVYGSCLLNTLMPAHSEQVGSVKGALGACSPNRWVQRKGENSQHVHIIFLCFSSPLFVLSPNFDTLEVSAFLCHVMWHITCGSLPNLSSALCSSVVSPTLPPIKILGFRKAVWLNLSSLGCYDIFTNRPFSCCSLS